ncbi:MAG: radical SAM protein [Candidatus Omnitrophica bacterium]|nr:radical SAM protein [Candidatus Omnitrophota bacterium]
MLLVHCNRLVSGVQYPGISSIAAFVKRAGHRVIFFDTAHYTDSRSMESYSAYRDIKTRIDLEFKGIKNKQLMPSKKPIDILLWDLENEFAKNRIDIIGFSSFSDDWPFALFLIKKVHAIEPNLPIIVGGIHAIVSPEQVIKHDEVSMVCVGEGEMPIVELLNSIDAGRIDLNIRNLWIRHEGKIIQNPRRPLLAFSENLPMLDWSLYSGIHFYFPFDGKLYRRGSVFMGRGCPYSCSFCINNFIKKIYPKEQGRTYLKSVEYLIKEIVFLKNNYNLEFLRFWDQTFLAMPKGYLSEFAKAYNKEVRLPFTIETMAQTVTHENAKMLVTMGCQSVSVGVETSNENLRKNILNKPIKNEVYDRCFKILSEYGLRKVANFMFFLPHQTLDDMWEDVSMCKRWGIDHPSARIFYPYRGTQLREYCLNNDLLDLDLLERIENENAIGEIGNLNENHVTFQDTVLKFDNKLKEEGRRLLDNFILFQETEESAYVDVRKLLIKNDMDSNDALRRMERQIYIKRFKEEPLTANYGMNC